MYFAGQWAKFQKGGPYKSGDHTPYSLWIKGVIKCNNIFSDVLTIIKKLTCLISSTQSTGVITKAPWILALPEKAGSAPPLIDEQPV